jgi:peroxiredoxin Q/BCP
MKRRSLGLVLAMLPLATACNHAGSAEAPAPPPSAATASPISTAAATPAAGSLLAVGSDIPDLTAPAQDGKLVRLRELKGKPVVIYFYPKDDTPGCTIEAKGIRDQYAELSSRAVVLGVSADSLDSHKAFASKYELPFPLLDDTNHALANGFGVPLSNGKAKRVTFVIDAQGKVRKVFPNVDPSGHAAELIDALKNLG